MLGTVPVSARASPPRVATLDILRRLDFPRDLRTGIDAARDSLARLLVEAELRPIATPFTARPWRLEIAAVLLCVAAAAVLTARRSAAWAPFVAALAVVAAGASIAGGLDALAPTRTLTSFEVVVEPQARAASELWIGAHYDSKTEWFDHAGRAAGLGLMLGVAVAAWIGARWRPGRRRVATAAGAAALVGAAAILAGSRFATPRSHGIVDDAASVAVLIETAMQARAAPPQHARLRFIFWSGEEIGAQGSAAFVRTHAASAVPRWAINLECLGAGAEIGWAAHDGVSFGSGRRDAHLLAALRQAAGAPLPGLGAPFVSDAGSLRRAGIPTITLVGLAPGGRMPRGLHRPQDQIARLDFESLERAQELLERWIARADRPGGVD